MMLRRQATACIRAHSKRLPSHAQARCLATPTTHEPSPNDAFANGTNAYYVEEMFRLWRQDPKSVHSSWQVYFSGMENGLPSYKAFQPPPSSLAPAEGAPSLYAGSGGELTDHLKTQLMVRAYQVRGHRVADLDPLGILDPDLERSVPPELEISHYGFTERDMDKQIGLGPGILPHFATDDRQSMTLREIIALLKRIYCGAVGIQYVHIPSKEQCDWIRERVEVPKPWNYSIEEKRMILDRLIWSTSFEKFIASKYPNEKRFGLEGCESLIPGMKALIDRSVEHGVKHITIGMPHRGRLNVLANVIRKPIEAILNEFMGTADPDDWPAGDVKYHLGANYVRPTPSGKRVSLSLVANPSHLEAEDPVVLGRTRAIQHFENDEQNHTTAMGVLLHGDAAFAGQGVVYETMGMHSLPHYGTGGTIHLIINNQIGFTTDPRFARSTPYPSDIAKSIDAPIFHVNGDNAEAVNFVCQLAADYRAKWKKDVVIDIVCYRRHGHNETDQPSFTQPRMYKAIEKQPTTLSQYTKFLTGRKSFTQKDIDEHSQWVNGMLDKAAAAAKDYKPTSKEWLSTAWQGFPSPKELAERVLPTRNTGSDEGKLKRVGNGISSYPNGFSVHRNLARILNGRGKAVEEGTNIDWSTAEALAFGSLLLEKIHVRVSGQDVERGTFSQRHAILHDQENESQFVPLNNLGGDQARFVVCNSSLSEFGTLGFELGYSLVSPDSLTIWEAQFGDFANNAQCIIDQFICSGERKWLQRTGLVMSLPHGYDGQGPEHSSARIERFLQLCDDHPDVFPTPEKVIRQHQDCNMQVVYPTTPANYFHVLRRQIHRDFRKPLIVFFSKSLLRDPAARSSLEDMVGDTHFQRYIPESSDSLVAPEEIRKHVLCSGQVYNALIKERESRGIKDVAISRLEQISPFPYDLLSPHLDKYPNASILWCQEEPLNCGSWTYVEPRLRTAANETEHHKGKDAEYAGRPPTSSVATGSKAVHKHQIENFMNKAFE